MTHLSTPSLVAGARRGLNELFAVAAVSQHLHPDSASDCRCGGGEIAPLKTPLGAVLLSPGELPLSASLYHLKLGSWLILYLLLQRDFAMACAPLSPDGSGAVLWLNRLYVWEPVNSVIDIHVFICPLNNMICTCALFRGAIHC